jgi:hypothetical protein
MNEFKQAGLPHELIYAVSKLTGAKRTRTQKTSSTNSTVTSGSGSLMTFQLPNDSVIDLSTCSLIGKFYITASTGANIISYINPPAHQLFSMTQLSVNGGVVVSGSQNTYSHIVQEAYYRAQADQSYLDSHCLQNLNNMFTPVSGNANFGGQIATDATISAENNYIVFDNIPCCKTSRFLDTSVMGMSTISFKPSTIQVIKGTFLESRNAKWELRECVLECDVFSSLPEEYIALVKELVSMNKQFKMNICNEVSSIFTYNQSVLLNCSTQSLDAVMVVPVVNELGYYGDVNTVLVAPSFNFRWAPVAGSPNIYDDINFSLKIGNYLVPDTPYPRLLNLANATAESLYGDSMYAKHNLYVQDCSAANVLTFNKKGFAELNGVYFQTLSALREAGWSNYDQVISGQPTYGQSVVITVQSNKASPPPKLMVVAQTTSTIVFDPQSGAVSLIQ